MPSWLFLGVLGVLPFIAIVAVPLVVDTRWLIPASQIFVYYSACIVSFVSGTLWLRESKQASPAIDYLSNIITLTSFISLLAPPSIGLSILVLAYLSLYFIEYAFKLFAEQPPNYHTMRRYLTAIVILTHIALIALLQ